MPFYEYQVIEGQKGCEHCREVFEFLQPISAARLDVCPRCGAPLAKLISAPAVGASKTGLDDRAKAAGFHKLEKLGKGEYEKKY
jgi:putative FmdB family regulatory protein